MTSPAQFEPGLVARLEAQYGGDCDVQATAAWVSDFARRKRVQNPSAMLVAQVVRAAKKRAAERRQQSLALPTGQDELERYAEFHAALYHAAIAEQLSPRALALRLESARNGRFPRLNALVAAKLLLLGDTWPELSLDRSPTPGVSLPPC